jgi:dihydroorotase
MNPPLRAPADRAALVDGVAGGALSVLATDHAPHTAESKAQGMVQAPFGVVGLETAVGATYTALVRNGPMSVMDWLKRWTEGPASVLGWPTPSLAPGSPANLVLLDLQTDWLVDPGRFVSRSRNTPFARMHLVGRPSRTFRDGALSWDGKRLYSQPPI